jgi:LysR family hydrogen peroxide-inducible transcriptional activator
MATMTLTEMRYISTLDKTRHFGRAADLCHVSQPTLSVAIKKVEQQIGAPLFERGATEIRTTPLGEEIVAQIKRVLDETLRLEEIATQNRDPLKGPLRVGVIYTIAPYLLPALIPVLHRLAPEMPLFLREDFTANLLPALKDGELDVLVLALPVTLPGVVSQAVYEEPFRVVVPAAHPWAMRHSIKNDELEGENLLLLGSGNCFREQVLEACPRLQRAEGLSGSLEGSSLETIRHMVASGRSAGWTGTHGEGIAVRCQVPKSQGSCRGLEQGRAHRWPSLARHLSASKSDRRGAPGHFVVSTTRGLQEQVMIFCACRK